MARLELPPLPPTEPQWSSFQVWWQQVKEAVEANEAAQQLILDEIDEALSGTGGVVGQVAILGSFTIPTMILTAADAGANASITIAGHVRRYSDGREVTIAGKVISALAFATKYGVYYNDITRQIGSPVFIATTDLEAAQHNYAPGRHYVGTVTTPADGAGPTTGGSPPAGSGYTAGASAQVIL